MLPSNNRLDDLVTVVELINISRREIFVSMTSELVPAFVASVRSDPSSIVAHWAWTDVLDYRTVEYAMPIGEARKFVDGYVHAMGRSDWKVVSGAARKPALSRA